MSIATFQNFEHLKKTKIPRDRLTLILCIQCPGKLKYHALWNSFHTVFRGVYSSATSNTDLNFGPPTFLYNEHHGSFLGVRAVGA